MSLGGATPLSPPTWTQADPSYAWSFPRDHWSHSDYQTEWWYFTGHLASQEGRRFGYQFTFFRIGLATPTATTPDSVRSDWQSDALIMGHASIVDLDRGMHRFSELRYRTTPHLGGFPGAPGPVLAWSLGPPGTDARWTLRWTGDGFAISMRDDRARFALELETQAGRPPLLHGRNGYSAKSHGGEAASHYYSFPRLTTRGAVTLDGERHAVEGSSWMDKEFSSSHLTQSQVGWDWFGLQLDDGRDLMLYRLRRADGAIDFARGTLESANPGEPPRLLEASDWALEETGRWRSPRTGADYPARWSLTVAGSRLIVVPEVADQENVGRTAGGLFYWEGAVRVEDARGARLGQGYVELVGYGKGNRPPI